MDQSQITMGQKTKNNAWPLKVINMYHGHTPKIYFQINDDDVDGG